MAGSVYDDWTGNVINGVTIRSFDPGAVRAARASFCSRHPEASDEVDGLDDTGFLTRAGLFKRGKPTVASAILLGKPGEGMVPDSVSIRWRLLDEDGVQTDSRRYTGPMSLAVRQVTSMVSNPMCQVPEGDGFRSVSTYRIKSLTEALYNALAHQDYSQGGTVEVVEREGESVTVMNRGEFLAGSPEDVVRGKVSQPKLHNPFLFKSMVSLGLVAGGCSGIRGTYLSQAYRHFPLPIVRTEWGAVTFCLPGNRSGSLVRIMDTRDDLDLDVLMDLTALESGRYVSRRRLDLMVRRGLVEVSDGVPFVSAQRHAEPHTGTRSDREAVLELVDSMGSVTRADVIGLMMRRDSKGLTEKQLSTKATNVLQSLRKEGMIEKSAGSTKSAEYVLSRRSLRGD